MKEITTSEFSAELYSPITWGIVFFVVFCMVMTPIVIIINTYLLAKPYDFLYLPFTDNKMIYFMLTLLLPTSAAAISYTVVLEILDYTSQKIQIIDIKITEIKTVPSKRGSGSKHAFYQMSDGNISAFFANDKMLIELADLPRNAVLWQTKYSKYVYKLILDDGKTTYNRKDLF
jgi:hypothetical protein